jgi:DNA-binding NtrC family response regulator
MKSPYMNKILFVDDDNTLLKESQRQLQDLFDIDIAQGSEQGLSAISDRGPYAVIISDLMLLGTARFEFLERARQIAPKSVFIMLTGHADLEVSMRALNEGHVFRLLTKPCKMHVVEKAIQAGLEKYDKNTQISLAHQLPSDKRYRSNILIVDDDYEVLTVLSAALKASGKFNVLAAESGQVALSILNLLKIDVMIADRQMPEMSGVELISSVQQRYPDIHTFLMTWQLTPALEHEIKAVGAMGCFEKPLVLNDIIDTICRITDVTPSGQIYGISTAGFLQMIETEEKTCVLQIRLGNLSGRLFFQKGRLVGAETGHLKHEAAAIEIINWKQATIEVINANAKKEIGITQPLMQILMEAARLDDETDFHQ